MSGASIKGPVFEAVVKRFGMAAGYHPLGHQGTDRQLFNRPDGLPMIHGLGEAHNADLLFAPPIQFPLAPTTRLLIECKGYAKSVSLGIVRGAVGLRTDINAFRQLEQLTIDRRQQGQRRAPDPEHFPYYHVAVASLFGFSTEAQHYAAAHHIELLDYSQLPIIGELSAEITALPSAPPGQYARVTQAINRLLGASDGPADERSFGDAIGPELMESLHRSQSILSSVSASYVATLTNGLTVNMLARQPLHIPERRAESDFKFTVRFRRDNYRSWWIETGDSNSKLEFNVPPKLLQLWERKQRQPETALQIKGEYMRKIELAGPFADGSGKKVFRHMVGELDGEFLNEVRRARRELGVSEA